MESKVVVELKEIKKEFPGVMALDRVNMKICSSSIHALVGENGAGKSTLMKILSGTYANYGGSIGIDGQEVHMRNEKDAFALGISIVAQELNCVPELTIAQNLFLGREPLKHKIFLDQRERTRRTQELLTMMGLDYKPETKMEALSVAQRQMIEILKALSRNSRVIIMDEPTSALTNAETVLLFKKIKELKEMRVAIRTTCEPGVKAN